jgi:ABC-type spermidine/putrescine transport system permease subunit I
MRKAVLALLIAWTALFYAVPIAISIGISFTTKRVEGGIDPTPTLSNYDLERPVRKAIARTAGIAAISGLVCAAAALAVSIDALLRPSALKERAILGLAIFSLVTNALMKVHAWALLVPGADPWFATLIGLIHTYFPLALLVVFEGVRTIDPGLVRAARDLGAGEAALWLRIALPLSKRFALGAALLVAVFVSADFLVPQVLGRGKLMLVGNRMYDVFYTNANWPAAMALGSLLTALLFVVLAAFYLRRRPA